MRFLALLLITVSELSLAGCSRAVYADQPTKRTKVEIPLTVYHEGRGYARAEGFWQSTSSSEGKQLIAPIAVNIRCLRESKACTESVATVMLGVLKAELDEYDISSWTENGIIADDTDEGECAIGHRLSIDFKSSSVTVTDYPKKVDNSKLCAPFTDANSYALHGGYWVLYPAVGAAK